MKEQEIRDKLKKIRIDALQWKEKAKELNKKSLEEYKKLKK